MTWTSAPGIPKKKPAYTSAAMIIKIVSDYFNVQKFFTPDNIKRRNRKREIVVARQTSMYLIKKNTSMSLVSIGGIFGKDHTTVIHSIKTINDLLDTDPQMRQDITFLNNQLNN